MEIHIFEITTSLNNCWLWQEDSPLVQHCHVPLFTWLKNDLQKHKAPKYKSSIQIGYKNKNKKPHYKIDQTKHNIYTKYMATIYLSKTSEISFLGLWISYRVEITAVAWNNYKLEWTFNYECNLI